MRNQYWGIVLIVLGVLFLLDNMNVADFGYVIRTFWPLILILWGIGILIKKKEPEVIRVFSDISEKVEGELFHKSNVFGDAVFNVTSQNFKGGSISTVAGDCEIDLAKAVIADGEHWLRVSGVFGDVRIELPKNASIAVSANSVIGDVKVFEQKKSGFLSAIQYASPHYEAASKKLKMSVTQVFGDIGVQ